MIIPIDRQNDVPRITENGKLVYSEKSDTLYIRTLKEGTKAIGGNTSIVETDPVFQAWLATPPNISIFTNDEGYLTSFSETDPIFSLWQSTYDNHTDWDTAYGWGNHASAGYTPQTRNITINGTTQDLSSDRTWTIATRGLGGSLLFTFDSSTTASDPTSGKLRFNNSTPASITQMYISDTSGEGLNLTDVINNLSTGQQLLIRQQDDATKAIVVEVSSTVTDNGSWFTVPITYKSVGTGGLPNNNKDLAVAKMGGSFSETDPVFTTWLGTNPFSSYLTSATAAATYQPIGSYLTTQKGAFGLTLSGTLTTGSKGYVILPYNCTITKWYITADVSGSIVIDIKKSGVSIVGAGNKPTLSTASNNSASISGWTTSSLVDGDVLEFNVDSVATVTKVTLTIKITI